MSEFPYEKPDRHHLPDDCRASWKCGEVCAEILGLEMTVGFTRKGVTQAKFNDDASNFGSSTLEVESMRYDFTAYPTGKSRTG